MAKYAQLGEAKARRGRAAAKISDAMATHRISPRRRGAANPGEATLGNSEGQLSSE